MILKPKLSPEGQEWYAEGLHFECQKCGKCCSGAPGTVEFTPEEGAAMARELGLDTEEFLYRYSFVYKDRLYLREEENGEYGFDCVMLERTQDPDGTEHSLCKVHNGRPMQCRTWPFWPESLRTKRSWEQAGQRCVGINRGPLFTLERINSDRDKTPW